MKTTIKSNRKAARKPARRKHVLANAATTKTARKAAPVPRAKKHHILANAATRTISASHRLQVSSSSFDPALPVDGSLIIAGELRNQFNGLVVMIQSIPSGPPGPQGAQGIQGPPFALAIIDGVTTLLPGESAWVTSSFDGTDVHFAFGIPRGDVGVQGQQGIQGPPFAQAVVDGVTTLPPGYDATVTVSFDGTNVHFAFGIPRGDAGEQGQQGIQGEPGIPGAPGEVTTAQLNAAIATTAMNPVNIQPLQITISDPPTQSEVQQVLDRMNALITALPRTPQATIASGMDRCSR